MNENISNAIDLALSGKINDMGNEIESALMQKVSDAISGKRVEVASSILTQNEDEEPVDDFEEDLDESESLTKGKRLVSKHGDGQHTAKVYYDPDWEEHQVHYYKDGKHMGEGPVSYHSGNGRKEDKQEAVDSAEQGIRRLNKQKTESYELSEKTMTSAEKAKEKKLKAKYDDSEMKAKMIKKYGPEKGESIYFATIRKQAMGESVEELDELDSDTLRSYLDKTKSVEGKISPHVLDTNFGSFMKRKEGRDRATSKLIKKRK